jgi:hypothetical protein
MTGSRLDRAEIVALLATLGDRDPADVPDRVDSLELAWLVHQVEQRHGVRLDLDDDELLRMATVSGAAEVLNAALHASGTDREAMHG